MSMRRKTITRDMIEAALAKNWNATQAAAHYGFQDRSIESACERFGITLPMMSFRRALPLKKREWVDTTKTDEPDRPDQSDKKVKLSASGDAIERALRKIAGK